jgi:Mg2+ and Co2+ transporter CorA
VTQPVAYSAFKVGPQPLRTLAPEFASISHAQTLQHCFMENDPPGFSFTDPTTLNLAYYPIRMVTSEWILYNLLMSRYVKHYENAMYHLDLKLHSHDFEAMQPWNRRSKQSLHKLHLMHSFIRRHRHHEKDQEVWDGVLDDIDYLSRQIKQWSSFFTSVVSTATSMLQLTDTRRSLIESAHVKQLTYMALVFIPLSFVASLFSMSEQVNPWGGRFWIYWVVSLPLLLIVLAISLLPLYSVTKKTSKR